MPIPGCLTYLGNRAISYRGRAQRERHAPYGTNCPPGYFDGGVVNIPTIPGGGLAYARIEIWGAYSLGLITVPEKCPAYGNQGPLFTNVLGGDGIVQPATPPAVLSALPNAPIILGFHPACALHGRYEYTANHQYDSDHTTELSRKKRS